MTKTATVTLSDFLLARIAEDEQAAGDAWGRSPEWDVAEREQVWGEDHDETVLAAGKPRAEIPGPGSLLAAEHIARWDPARVLAECAAKRRIVKWYEHETDTPPDGTPQPPAMALRLLALPYADHADFREEWRV